MSKALQAIRGMNDCLPAETGIWQMVETVLRRVASNYGFAEIRMPIVESTALFKRSIGEVTDIVEKEMYTFEDRNGDSLTLRPEGTASCVRACEEHSLLSNNQSQRLWYLGPMFRHERPQKGRYRQFFQIGVETFGMATPDIDAEVILLTARLWQKLGIQDAVELQLNTIGSAQTRIDYKAALVEFLTPVKDQLDEDSQRRLATNPLRILDSKDQNTQQLLNNAPQLHDYLDDESREHFAKLTQMLDAAGVAYQINQRLVRGLDYYGKTVFEWVTDKLGSQGTVCAGGRYDGLVEQLGGKPTPAVGFAMGVERLILLLETLSVIPQAVTTTLDVYITALGGDTDQAALLLADAIRQQQPQIRVQSHCGGGSYKSQMKKALNSSARFVILLENDDIDAKRVRIKPLNEDGEQVELSNDTIAGWIADQLA